MKDKAAFVRVRLSRVFEAKLQERTARLYSRALERWNRRPASDIS